MGQLWRGGWGGFNALAGRTVAGDDEDDQIQEGKQDEGDFVLIQHPRTEADVLGGFLSQSEGGQPVDHGQEYGYFAPVGAQYFVVIVFSGIVCWQRLFY